MNGMQIFQNVEFGPIRIIKRDGGELRFVARDVCACLGIGNTGDVIAALDDDEKGIDNIDTPRRQAGDVHGFRTGPVLARPPVPQAGGQGVQTLDRA